MKRRNFLKTMIGAAVAAALPGCRLPTGPNEKAFVGVDLAKLGGDTTAVHIVELKSGEICRTQGFQHFESVRFIESAPEDQSGNWDAPNWDAYSWHEKPPFEQQSVEYRGYLMTKKQRDSLEQAIAEHNTSELELDRAMIEGMRNAARQLDISAWRDFTAS